MISAIATLGLTSCGEDFFDTEYSSVASKEQIDEIGNSSPDALIKVVEPLMLGLNNYTYQYNTQGSGNTVHEDFGLMGIYHLGDVMNDDLAFYTRGSGWFTAGDHAANQRSQLHLQLGYPRYNSNLPLPQR